MLLYYIYPCGELRDEEIVGDNRPFHYFKYENDTQVFVTSSYAMACNMRDFVKVAQALVASEKEDICSKCLHFDPGNLGNRIFPSTSAGCVYWIYDFVMTDDMIAVVHATQYCDFFKLKKPTHLEKNHHG